MYVGHSGMGEGQGRGRGTPDTPEDEDHDLIKQALRLAVGVPGLEPREEGAAG